MAGYANFVISLLFLAGAVMLGLIAAYDPREEAWKTRVAAEAFIALVFCALAIAKFVHALEIMRIARAETPESLLPAEGDDDVLRRRANVRAAGEMVLFLLAMAAGAFLFEDTRYRVAIAVAAFLMMVGPVYRIVRWGRGGGGRRSGGDHSQIDSND